MSHEDVVQAAHARPVFAQTSFSVASAPVRLTEAMIYPAAH